MRVLFDSQQLNYFVEPGSGPQPEDALARTRAAMSRGEIEVVGSLDLLQELLEAAPRASGKSRKMVEVFFDLAGHHVLLPLNERHIAEVAAGGLLPETAQRLSRERRRLVQRMARSGRAVLDLAEDLFAEKSRYLESERETQARVEERLRAAGGPPTEALMREWVEEVDIDEWVADIVLAGNGSGHHDVEVANAGVDRFPSAWTFVACRLAQLVRTLGEGLKIQASDLADAHLAACGPYIDVFVTDDRRLRGALDLLGERLPFEWMPSAEFFTRST